MPSRGQRVYRIKYSQSGRKLRTPKRSVEGEVVESLRKGRKEGRKRREEKRGEDMHLLVFSKRGREWRMCLFIFWENLEGGEDAVFYSCRK